MRPENTSAALAAVAPIAAKGDAIRLDTDIGSILGYIVVGLVVGLLARLLVPGRDPIGLLGTLVIGIVGAVLGGWLAGAFFRET
ncbi:MAG: GlsB/YeaQ/YmgE family stress response membrane protein, partial [Ilumatobacteraceae bacterium]